MNRGTAVLLVCALAQVACTDRALIRNAAAAYQYEKSNYQHTCPLPPKPQSPECSARDQELSEDFFQIEASTNAVERSQGGKLPKAARAKLKQIRKDLDK